jgi:acetyl esterase/lipase
VREELDVVYGTGGGEDLKLDLYAPREIPGLAPAVAIIHGGGWVGGCKEEYRPLAQAFAQRGYVAVTVSYRLAPQHKFPAPVEDVKCAVRWLRAGAARYRVDPERIGAVGISAGGHLALLLALTGPGDGLEGQGGNAEQSSRVQAVVNCMGPTDLARPGWSAATDKVIAELMGGNRDTIPAAYRAASPLAYVRRGAPPVLTIHGTTDTVVPYEQARLLHAALVQVGATSRLEPLRGKGHGENWDLEDLKRVVGALIEFTDQHLKGQR